MTLREIKERLERISLIFSKRKWPWTKLAWNDPPFSVNEWFRNSPEIVSYLLQRVIEAETRIAILEWQREHRECQPQRQQCNGPGIDIRHGWTTTDWIAHVKRGEGLE